MGGNHKRQALHLAPVDEPLPPGVVRFPQRGDINAKPQPWPELMCSKTAALYVDEPSPRAFLRRVGKVYPKPIRIAGRRGDLWRKTDLDAYIAKLSGSAETILDAADVL